MTVRYILMYAYFFYIALMVSIVAIYKIFQYAYRYGKVKLDWFFYALLTWMPNIIMIIF